MADQVRCIGKDPAHSLADQLSLLLDVASNFHSPRELLDHAVLATSRDSEGKSSAVRLMSMNRAKGLEFDHVFLPAFEDGVIPSAYGDPDEEAKARR